MAPDDTQLPDNDLTVAEPPSIEPQSVEPQSIAPPAGEDPTAGVELLPGGDMSVPAQQRPLGRLVQAVGNFAKKGVDWYKGLNGTRSALLIEGTALAFTALVAPKYLLAVGIASAAGMGLGWIKDKLEDYMHKHGHGHGHGHGHHGEDPHHGQDGHEPGLAEAQPSANIDIDQPGITPEELQSLEFDGLRVYPSGADPSPVEDGPTAAASHPSALQKMKMKAAVHTVQVLQVAVCAIHTAKFATLGIPGMVMAGVGVAHEAHHVAHHYDHHGKEDVKSVVGRLKERLSGFSFSRKKGQADDTGGSGGDAGEIVAPPVMDDAPVEPVQANDGADVVLPSSAANDLEEPQNGGDGGLILPSDERTDLVTKADADDTTPTADTTTKLKSAKLG